MFRKKMEEAWKETDREQQRDREIEIGHRRQNNQDLPTDFGEMIRKKEVKERCSR